jgi:hypothetical protein
MDLFIQIVSIISPSFKKVTGCKLFNHEVSNMESAADISMEHFLHRPI